MKTQWWIEVHRQVEVLQAGPLEFQSRTAIQFWRVHEDPGGGENSVSYLGGVGSLEGLEPWQKGDQECRRQRTLREEWGRHRSRGGATCSYSCQLTMTAPSKINKEILFHTVHLVSWHLSLMELTSVAVVAGSATASELFHKGLVVQLSVYICYAII